jgi:hypothetical protein
MLSRKHAIIALGLLFALTGLLNVNAQTQQKKPKEKIISTQTGPSPVIKFEEHAVNITPCAGSPADSQVQLVTSVENYSTTNLNYIWTVNGRPVNNTGPTMTWDLTGLEPGIYTARVEVDNPSAPIDEKCYAFATTKVRVLPCPPPPVVCPNVSIYCPDSVTLGAPVTFTANLSGGTPGITPIYNWTVSAGTIISGQGTPTIQVDTTGLGGQSITANLAVEGYSLNCPATCTVQVPRKISSTMVDYYAPIRLNDEKARLDNFAIQLQNDPNAKGYVIVYGGAKAKPAERQGRIKRAYDYLVNTRGLSADRIVTMEGGMRDVTTTELWIVPLGADPPSAR